MSLPPFAPIPPANIRLSLGPDEWEACLDAWLTLTELTLRLPAGQFDKAAGDHGSLPDFLISFYHELVVTPRDAAFSSSKAISLRKTCFKLVNRAVESGSISKSLMAVEFLSNFCRSHVKSSALKQLMSNLWQRRSSLLSPLLQKRKDELVQALEAKNVAHGISELTQVAPVMHASADIGAFFMTGSDFLDSLTGAYSRSNTPEQKKAISTVVYLGLFSCVRTSVPNLSLLSDHLYTLKSQADKANSGSLLADAITNTALLARLRQSLSAKAPERLIKLLDSLETYRTPSLERPKKHFRRTPNKRSKPPPDPALHIHHMSLVTKVQDLFPDLGSGFVLKLLGEYEDDVEQVTAHLLDDSLPQHLASLDRTEQAPIYDTDSNAHVEHLAPRFTPPAPMKSFVPERRNVFDGDELDRLEFDAKRLRLGKQDRNAEADDHPNKAAILSALAAFDSDDDERDDTYDVEDVGGTVDTGHPDGEPDPAAMAAQDENDTSLFAVYKSSPELFGRTFDIRKGQARQALKAETGMTDEAIEGWAIMLQRDPRRLRRLEAQLGSFDGKQRELASTAYRESPGNTETEDSDAGPQGFRGGFRGRGGRGGRGRGGGRGGGNVAGPSNDANTAQAQRRKEASKGSRANHNRRDQRAKKMARGGFPG